MNGLVKSIQDEIGKVIATALLAGLIALFSMYYSIRDLNHHVSKLDDTLSRIQSVQIEQAKLLSGINKDIEWLKKQK